MAKPMITFRSIAGLGHALLDQVYQVSEAQFDQIVQNLPELAIDRGAMHIVSFSQRQKLQNLLPSAIAHSAGGSVANTMSHLADAGLEARFYGTAGDDPEHQVLVSVSGRLSLHLAQQTGATGTCLTVVDPSGERTMFTDLGVSGHFHANQLQPPQPETLLMVEGYLFEHAHRLIFDLVANWPGPLAMSLSDAWCVDRCRPEFRRFIREHATIVFMNQAEAAALLPEFDDDKQRFDCLRGWAPLVFVTLGAQGAVAIQDKVQVNFVAEPKPVVDTTGAGDAFAATVLGMLARDQRDLLALTRAADCFAGEVVGAWTARPPGIDLSATLSKFCD